MGLGTRANAPGMQVHHPIGLSRDSRIVGHDDYAGSAFGRSRDEQAGNGLPGYGVDSAKILVAE